MRSKKLLILYAFLLIVAVVTMVQLWRLNQRPQEIGPRDYPEIKEDISYPAIQCKVFNTSLAKRSLNYPDWRFRRIWK